MWELKGKQDQTVAGEELRVMNLSQGIRKGIEKAEEGDGSGIVGQGSSSRMTRATAVLQIKKRPLKHNDNTRFMQHTNSHVLLVYPPK